MQHDAVSPPPRHPACAGHRQQRKAKAAGKYKGRPVSIDAAQVKQLRATLSAAAIAKKLGIGLNSVYRALRT
jgi:DNA invertase Pin-like site-specific DNA recombinase